MTSPLLEPKKPKQKKPPTTGQISIRLSLELLTWLDAMAKKRGISRNKQIADCVSHARDFIQDLDAKKARK